MRGTYSRDELQYQLNKLNAEKNRRNLKRDSSADWGTQARKEYERALKDYNDFLADTSNSLTREDYEKKAKELKDALSLAKKEYDKYKPEGNKDAESERKAADKAAREAERRRQAQQKLNDELTALQQQNQQDELGLMEEGTEKKLAQIDADAFVLDCMPNPTGDEINERAEYMVRTIREAHPKAPIIMIESYRWENNYTDSVARAAGDDRANAFVSQALRLIQAGVPYLYLIRDHNAIGDDHEGSADGIHPNDLGFARIIAAYEPELIRILRENGIE